MTYGGNEEIVLKGPKENSKSRKRQLQSQRMYMHNVHGILLPEYRLLQKQNGSMLLQLMLDKENIIFKGQKKYPWSGSYTSFWKKRQSKEIRRT
jgi:hypothetical protein